MKLFNFHKNFININSNVGHQLDTILRSSSAVSPDPTPPAPVGTAPSVSTFPRPAAKIKAVVPSQVDLSSRLNRRSSARKTRSIAGKRTKCATFRAWVGDSGRAEGSIGGEVLLWEAADGIGSGLLDQMDYREGSH